MGKNKQQPSHKHPLKPSFKSFVDYSDTWDGMPGAPKGDTLEPEEGLNESLEESLDESQEALSRFYSKTMRRGKYLYQAKKREVWH